MNVARVRLASALLAQGKAAEAVAEARKATEADTKSGQAFAVLALAIIAENKGNWNDAISQAQNGKFLNERDPFVSWRCTVFEGKRQPGRAVRVPEALETDPTTSGARALLSVQCAGRPRARSSSPEAGGWMPQTRRSQSELGTPSSARC